MLIRSEITGFRNKVYKSAGSIFVPMFDALVPKHRNILAVLESEEGKLLIPGSNIVTNDGDIYYAQKGAGAATTNAFGIHELASAGTPGKTATRAAFTTIANTQKAHTAGYPKVGDADADNTGGGANIVTYLGSYAKADFSASSITHGIITNASPVTGSPLLTGYAFAAAFSKTSNDTLKVFVNHQMNGV